MAADDVLGDGQSQPGAAGGTGAARIHPVEALGQARQVFPRDAWPGVDHGEHQARRATLALEIAPDQPRVLGDADQLAQVLQNLLDNALKHGGEGVGIRLAAAPARPGARWPARPGVVLSVTDTGPGIAREHLPRLTERFYRVDAGRSRSAGGTGLGLAIVKHIASRHRGQLRIESAKGSGTSVSIWLPAD